MQLNNDLLVDYSHLSLDELRQLRRNLDACEAQLLVRTLDVQDQLRKATAELVNRYQAEPELALSALPSSASSPS